MNAGALRDRIVIQKSTGGGTFGGETWSTIHECWGEYRQISGREYWAADQAQSEVSGKVRIRYAAGIEAHMRVIVNGERVLEITAPPIDPNGRRAELVLMTKEAG